MSTLYQFIERLRALHPNRAQEINAYATGLYADRRPGPDADEIAVVRRWAERNGISTAPPAPAVGEQPAAPAITTGRVARGMSPEVRRAMPSLAYRLYEWAEARADQRGRFTCTRPQAMKTLLASNGGIGQAIRLHVAAGVWRRDKPGGWRTRGRQRPRQTVYALVEDFDRTRAVAVYRGFRAANRERLERLRTAQRGQDQHPVPVQASTVPVSTGSVGAVLLRKGDQ